MRARWCAVDRGKTGPGWNLGVRACAIASLPLPGPPCGSGCETAVRAAGMFRKARRVNVRKRNDSEEEERERDEEQEPPPLLPPPGTGEEPGSGGGGDRAPGGESLQGPGLPPPSALTSGSGAEAGGCFPGGAEPGNGLKPRKRPRENKEVPRASLLSFQDEEEGNCRTLDLRPQHPYLGPPLLVPAFPGRPAPAARNGAPSRPTCCTSFPASGLLLPAENAFPRRHQPFLNNRLLLTVLLCISCSEGKELRSVILSLSSGSSVSLVLLFSCRVCFRVNLDWVPSLLLARSLSPLQVTVPTPLGGSVQTSLTRKAGFVKRNPKSGNRIPGVEALVLSDLGPVPSKRRSSVSP